MKITGVRVAMITGLLASISTFSVAHAAQNVATNGSMEDGGGPDALDPRFPAAWTLFGNVSERSNEANLTPVDGGFSLKAFGADPAVGAFQDVPATPGDSVTISASIQSLSTDPIGGDAEAGITLEFYDANTNLIPGSAIEMLVLNDTTALDAWTSVSITTNAPAQTAMARMVCTWTSGGAPIGSAYWDNCALTINGGTNGLENPDFEDATSTGMSPFGIVDWTGFETQEKSNDVAFHGDSSVKITAFDSGGGQFNGLFQDMGIVEAGDRIVFKTRALHTSTNALTGNARGGLKMEFFSAGEDPDLPDPTENLPINSNSTTNAWIEVDIGTTGVVVPEDANFARVVLIFDVGDPNMATNGTVWFDQAFAGINGSATNVLFNESFEDGTGGANGIFFWEEFGLPPLSETRKFISVDDALDGIAVARSRGNLTTGILQPVAVNPGEIFFAKVNCRIPQGQTFSPGAGIRAGIKVEWEGGSAPSNIDIGLSDNTLFPTDPTDEWKELMIDFTMPLGSRANLRLTNIVAGIGEGIVYFDGAEAVITNRFQGADTDGSNTMDLKDLAFFQSCFTGSGASGIGWPCFVFDDNEDDDVDLSDWSNLDPENNVTGP